MQVLPLGFCTMTRGKLQGDSDSEMTPFLRFSLMNALIFSKSTGEYEYGRIFIGFIFLVSIVNGLRFAGFPISRNKLGHLLFIHRPSFRGICQGGFMTAVTNVFLGILCMSEASFECDTSLRCGKISDSSTMYRQWMMKRDANSSINSMNSSGEAMRIFGVGLAGQSI